MGEKSIEFITILSLLKQKGIITDSDVSNIKSHTGLLKYLLRKKIISLSDLRQNKVTMINIIDIMKRYILKDITKEVAMNEIQVYKNSNVLLYQEALKIFDNARC